MAPISRKNPAHKTIKEAARFIDKAGIAISPQCGFASTVAGDPPNEAAERAKLVLCVRTAQQRRAKEAAPVARLWSMIFSENRFPLFGIML